MWLWGSLILNQRLYTLTFIMSLLLLYPKTLGNQCAQFKYSFLLSHFPPIYHGYWHYVIRPRIPTTCSHASCCHHCDYNHYCNVDFVLFHDVTCYTSSLLAHIRINTIYLLNVMCALVVTCLILRRLECTTDMVCWNCVMPTSCKFQQNMKCSL